MEPITPAAMQCFCKPLMMCYRHWKPRETDVLHVLFMACGRGSITNFLGMFAKLWKVTVSSDMSIHPSTWNDTAALDRC
jgi:hypothetical protein